MPILAFKMPSRVASRPRAVKGRTGRRRSDPPRRRTFRPQNYSTRPPVKAWTHPVPEPLPPAPLLSLPGLLGTAAVVVAGVLWGTLNNKRRATYGPPSPVDGQFTVTAPVVGTYSPTGQNRITRGSYSGVRWTKASAGAPCTAGSGPQQYAPRTTTVGGIKELRISYGAQQTCGTLNTGFHVYLTAGGTTAMEGLTAGSGSDAGWRSMVFDGWEVQALPGATDVRDAAGLMPWSGTSTPPPSLGIAFPPAVAPAVLPARVRPVTAPDTPTGVSVEPAGPAAPVSKPAAPPLVAGRTPSQRPQSLPAAQPVVDGVMAAPTRAPVPVTNPDAVFPIPGKPGITGNGPQPNLPEMAKELGRIERKLEGLLNPQGPEVNPVPNWLEDLGKAIEALESLTGGGSYTLTEPCDPDGDGVFARREIQYNGAAGMLGLLSNKIDALAQLQQAAKDLRQPICPGRKPVGELVSVRWVSLGNSSAGERPLRKEFRYRDQSYSDQCAHANHWEGFEWDAGPYCVMSTNLSWGEPQVWAASPAEGKRVISHAADIAGVDLGNPKHRWSVSTSSNPRYGRSGRMVPDRKALNSIWVTKRDGPSGLPEFPVRE